MARSITVIPQTRTLHAPCLARPIRRRVAGYARVSTDSDEQFTSYEAQVDYYTRYIQSHPDWDFVRVYTDEGISALSTRNRDGFNSMITDALAGKIDLIVTKSVSRFARNTVDSLTTIRKLKEHNVECYFEKEGIYTFDGKGELLLTIMSSLAQEESRSISENVTWGKRKQFADGKVTLGYRHFLGYDKGPDGNLVINPEQAETVRLIFRKFMDGLTPIGICKLLEEMQIPSPSGKKNWSKKTVESILTNEKYKGDALLQKTFTVDYLTKKHKANEGEVPQYYITGNHEAIIPRAEFDQVQAEIARRKQLGRAFSGHGVYATKLVCGDCGGFYGQKIWHSTSENRKKVWRCNHKYTNTERCTTPSLTEKQIQLMFMEAAAPLFADHTAVCEKCEARAAELANTARLEAQIGKLQATLQRIADENRAMIHQQAGGSGSPSESFHSRSQRLTKQYAEAEAKLAKLTQERDSRIGRGAEMLQFAGALREIMGEASGPDGVPAASQLEQAFPRLVRQVTVRSNSTAVFEFRNESKKTVRVPAWDS